MRQKRLAKKLLHWSSKKLFSKQLLPNIVIILIFTTLKNGVTGLCGPIDNHYKPRIFEIEIDRHLKKQNMIDSLLHELAHAKQYAKQEIKDSKNDIVTWKGKKYCDTKINYWQTPWEMDAFGIAYCLDGLLKEQNIKL